MSDSAMHNPLMKESDPLTVAHYNLAVMMARADQMPEAEQDEFWDLIETVRRGEPLSADGVRRLLKFEQRYPVSRAMLEPYLRDVAAHHSKAYDAALIEVIPAELLNQERTDEEWGPFLISYHHKHTLRDQARHIKRLAASKPPQDVQQ